MGWIGWVVLSVVIIGYIGIYSILKVASDSDDIYLADKQYLEDDKN